MFSNLYKYICNHNNWYVVKSVYKDTAYYTNTQTDNLNFFEYAIKNAINML